jgi:glucose-1-phosphate cytidylyltransferase
MKVVLFCGGYGMRMRDGSNPAPKPMMKIGDRPLLWHVMRYYAHFGCNDFVLCLGYGAAAVKEYFLRYEETLSNDFVFSEGGRTIELLGDDIADWRITFVDTGLNSPIGERLRRVRAHVENEEVFLANYADTLTDAPLLDMIDNVRRSDAVGSLLAVPPQAAFHLVSVDDDRKVTRIDQVSRMPFWENGGYFVFKPEIFDVLGENEDLVEDALGRLTRAGRVIAHCHTGFWAPADTLKERAVLEEMYHRGDRPWMVWDGAAGSIPVTVADLGSQDGLGAAQPEPLVSTV